MKWTVAAASIFLLVAPTLGAADEGGADMPDRAKLGEFVPSTQPYPAPAISLADTSGHSVELSELQGKLVIVNLWATWCGPCLREMPSLERLQSRLGERVAVLAVSEDRGGNKSVEPFIAKLGLKSVKIYIDPKSEVGHAFGVRGLPTSFLIDREGKVLGRVEGAAEWDSPKILGVLEPLLSGGGVVKASSRQARL
jgi:thiol-disulfide isomerase/thioredoxin